MLFLDIVLNILSSGLPCALIALGIFLTYRILDFADLSAEGSFLIGASVTAVIIVNEGNPWLATIVSFIAGGCCGIITGILNRFLKIPKLLSGIITMTGASSIAMLIMGLQNGNAGLFGTSISFTNIVKDSPRQTIFSMFAPWKQVGNFYVMSSPWAEIIKVGIMFAIVVLAMILLYVFFGTEYGMAIRATGLNENMANAQGINANISTIVCIAIGNALIGLGGSLYAQDIKYVSTASATGYLVVGLAAILIGEAIFGKRTFKNWIISVALGAIVYFVIITIATRLGFPTELKSLLYAVLITIALCLPLIKNKINDLKLFIKAKKEAKS